MEIKWEPDNPHHGKADLDRWFGNSLQHASSVYQNVQAIMTLEDLKSVIEKGFEGQKKHEKWTDSNH